MNYALGFSSDERIFTSRNQGMIGSGRNLFLAMEPPWALNLKNTHLTYGSMIREQFSSPL